jgi:TonB family protein
MFVVAASAQASFAADTVYFGIPETERLTLAVQNCARTPDPTADELVSVISTTTVSARVVRGRLSDVAVTSASGNPQLDKRVIGCFKKMLIHKSKVFAEGQIVAVPLYWHSISEPPNQSPNTITVQSNPFTAPIPVTRHYCGDMYPEVSVRLLQEGTTTLTLDITATGQVADAIVSGSSGHDALDAAAIACAKLWTFRPATQNGSPIDAKAQIAIAWKALKPPGIGDVLNALVHGEGPKIESVPGPPGWSESPAPGSIASYSISDGGSDQSVALSVSTTFSSLDNLADYNRYRLSKMDGVASLTENRTTVCGEDIAWEAEYTQHLGNWLYSRDLSITLVAIVRGGTAYAAAYYRHSGSARRPDGDQWIHNAFCTIHN